MNPKQRLSPEELGALDHFHTGGLPASLELLELARIRAEDRVLDIGAGLGGAARLMASVRGCRVDCIELSADYCVGAALLNRLTGLDGQIEVHTGSKPGGRFAFQEMAAGESPTTLFPLPWATDPADSFLEPAGEMRLLLGECGFKADAEGVCFSQPSATHGLGLQAMRIFAGFHSRTRRHKASTG